TTNQGNEATITVHLPADANLTIDGQPTNSTSDTRTFVSPPLKPGKTYTYTLRAETNRDGRPREVKKTVDVQAGRPTDVTLDFRTTNREDESIKSSTPDDEATPAPPRRRPDPAQRTPPAEPTPPRIR